MNSLALAYIKTGQTDPATELLNSVIHLSPDNGLAWRYLGYCYLKLNDTDNALISYAKAVQINESDWDAHRGSASLISSRA